MALKTINDLTALTTPASTDLVGVWAVGAARMRKSTIDQVVAASTVMALLAGRAGGQHLIGGTGSGDDLTLTSTSHGTKGDIILDGPAIVSTLRPVSDSTAALALCKANGDAVLTVDTTNGQIGIGVTSTSLLSVKASSLPTGTISTSAAISDKAFLLNAWDEPDDAKTGLLTQFTSGPGIAAGVVMGRYGSYWGTYIAFHTHPNDTVVLDEFLEVLRIAQNVKLGGIAERSTTEGARHLDIFDGTAPVGTLANGISIYSAAGECYIMDAAGNATLQSPHDDNGEWIFYSKNTVTGREVRVDMEKMLRALNELHGWDYFHEEQ